jgi:post-segregation antitoxin (ccd killing protein)
MRSNSSIPFDPALIAEAESLGLDVQNILTSALKLRIKRRRDELAWQESSREAIDAYNARIKRDGLWHLRLKSR